jgi:hypothetical protein
MAEAVLNCSIDRCLQGPPIVCADADVIEKGQIEVIGANLVVIAAGAADGLTQRTADAAAGLPPRPDRWAPLYTAEDITVDKMPGVDSIAAGTKVWFSVDDNQFVDSLSDVDAAGDCHACGVTLELSDDVNDTVRIAFNGFNVPAEAGTG